MKRIVYIIALVFFAGYTQAQQDTKAKEILDKVSAKNKSYTSLQGSFEYILENTAEAIKEKSTGKFALKGDNYFVDVMGVETYFDGTDIYSYIKDANEVTISEPDTEDEDFLSPSNLFKIYEKGFTYKFVTELTENGKRLYMIDLFPIDKTREFKSITLKIEKDSLLISSMKSIGKTGDNVEINITSCKINKTLNATALKFDETKYSDIEVVDMR